MKNAVQLKRAQFAKVIPDFVAFSGGLDTVTPPFFLAPGYVRESQNYECDVHGGYARIVGYERFDGHPSPSDAAYAVITITLTGSIAVGNTVTGVTSAATGVVVAVPTGQVVVTKITGTFVSGEVLNVAASPQATTTSAAITDGAATPLLHATYKNLAGDVYRSDIAAPTGSGNSLGGFRFGGVTYTFRNNAGATAAGLWKSSSSGWVAVALGRELAFTSGGATEIVEGNTITGATSAATAVITRVVLTSGTWAGGDAAGRFIFASQTGTFQAENLNVGASTNLATIAGNSSAITLLPSGRYECIIENFGGATGTRRVYGVDGVNRGFEFDGTVFVPIATGMTVDAPMHVYAHQKQLFYSFGASVQHCAPGAPYIWSVVLGAAEIGLGDTVAAFMGQPGSEASGALAIFTRNRMSVLYGSGVATWKLVPYRDELGAYAYTVRDIGFSIFLDDEGVMSLPTSQSFGNFSHSSLSARIRPWVNTQRTKVTESCIVRDKSQYRLFFSDGYALFVTRSGNKIAGMMPILFPNPVRWAWSSEESDGSETIFFGSSNGMVYQMERGKSFDGAAIEHYLHLAWNFSKSPRFDKTYQDCTLEVSGNGYATFQFSYQLGYASPEIEQPVGENAATNFQSGRWDVGLWDRGVWDGQTLMPSHFDMNGTAENASIMIHGNSDMDEAIRFSGSLINYSPRRSLR